SWRAGIYCVVMRRNMSGLATYGVSRARGRVGVGRFLGSCSTNRPAFGRSDPRTTTAPQLSTSMSRLEPPGRKRPGFQRRRASWVRSPTRHCVCSSNLAFRITKDWFATGISLDARSSNPPGETRLELDRLGPNSGWFYVDDETCNMQALLDL